jgi:hypothetical protein
MLLRSLIALLSLTASANAYTQCDVKSIAGPGATVAEEGSNPVAAPGGKYIYAGFMQNRHLSVATSSDWGKTLGPPVKIFNGPGSQHMLRLAAAGANVYALWGVVYLGKNDLKFAASHDHGATWQLISFGRYLANVPQIAADGANVHVVYHAAGGNMVVRNSTDEGRTFSDPVVLGYGASEEVAATAGQNVYAAWSLGQPRSETVLAVSHDNGKTFKVTKISADRPSGSNEPIFAVDKLSGRVSLIWRENTPMQGVYLQSLDNGDTWSTPLVIDDASRQYMVADDGTNIYITYLKFFKIGNTPDWQVFLTVSKDGGKTFPPAQNLSGPTGIQELYDDNERPIPWAWDGNGAFRVTGIKSDGAYVWNGRNGTVFASSGVRLGPGTTATPVHNSVVWRSPNQYVSYGACH